MAVVEGVGRVPVLLDCLQSGVVLPVPRAPVGLGATGEVGVLREGFQQLMVYIHFYFLNGPKHTENN